MKIFIILMGWVGVVITLIYFYKVLIRHILSLNKGLIETVDFIFSNIIQEVITNKDKIVDFEKTLTLLEEEKVLLYSPPYNLASLKKGWEVAKQQQQFLSKLLKKDYFLNEKEIKQLLKVLYALCKSKKVVEALLAIVTFGAFLVFKKRFIRGVYVYC